jgi:aminoglycoside phosphotransferase (APT) family kinase protein
VSDPAARLEIVRHAVPVDLGGAVLVESWSNDAWLTDESVLRVCWRGDRKRLLREAMLLESLPASVTHASVVAAGCTEGLTWMVVRRLPGERLDLAWPRLAARERRDAVVSLAGALKALHRWEPPAAVAQQLRAAPLLGAVVPGDLAGAVLVPLPVSRLFSLLEWLEEQPGMDRDLAGRVRMRVEEFRPLVGEAEFADGVVVHGDAHLANVLWHEGHLVALLDLEWVRLGPPDLEFEAICRDDPYIEARGSSRAVAASEVPVLVWLRAGYPELFDRPYLTERVWLYDICYRVRQLCLTREVPGPHLLQGLADLTLRPRVRFG